MITLAFYKGRTAALRHRIFSWCIRRATGGPYSHVELIAGPASLGAEAQCLSSCIRGGGVREKAIWLNPEKWDLLTLEYDAEAAERFIRGQLGRRYDVFGIFGAQILSFGWHRRKAWFCSELCAAAIGLPQPHRYAPQQLFELLTWAKGQGLGQGIQGKGTAAEISAGHETEA